MARVLIEEKTLKSIGDAIRRKTGNNYLIDPANMASEISEMKSYNQGYDDGHRKGMDDGYFSGYYAGGADERYAFWDFALDSGRRDYFAYAFGPVFNDNNFKPNRKIIPRTRAVCYRSEGKDDCEHLRYEGSNPYCALHKDGRIANESTEAVAAGIFQSTSISKIDGSHVDWNCVPKMLEAFSSASKLKSVTGINAKNCTDMRHLFRWCHNLETVEFLNYSKATNWLYAFDYCYNLKNVVFSAEPNESGIRTEYIVGSIDFSDCEALSRDSIMSIINALSDNASYLHLTLSKTAVDNAFVSDEWSTLIAEKPNWSIILA